MFATGKKRECCPVSVYHHFMFFRTLKKKESKFKLRRKLFYLVSTILFFNDSFL